MANDSSEFSKGILVVERINWFSNPPSGKPVAKRDPSITGSHDDILRRYRGIEGRAWPDSLAPYGLSLNKGLVRFDQYDLAFKYYCAVREKYLCDIVHCQQGETGQSHLSSPPSDFQFCGFDYGYYESEVNHYSSLFNEVIYGKYAELRVYGASLNDCLLFPNLEIVKSVELTRNALIKNGADLETTDGEEVFGPMAIHAPSTTDCRERRTK